MKNTDISWRSRIGNSRTKKTSSSIPSNFDMAEFVIHTFSTSLIMVLLMIGNVESNPGPPKGTPPTVDPAEVCELVRQYRSTITNFNPQHANSIFGMVSDLLNLENTVNNRKHLQRMHLEHDNNTQTEDLEDAAPVEIDSTLQHNISSKVSISDLCPDDLLNIVQNISNWTSLNRNANKLNSLHAVVLQKMGLPNTSENRSILTEKLDQLARSNPPLQSESSSLPASYPGKRILNKPSKRRRLYNKKRADRPPAKPNTKTIDKEARDSTVSIAVSQPAPEISEITTRLTNSFKKSIMSFAVTPCEVCDKLSYQDKLKQFHMTNHIQKLFQPLGISYDITKVLTVCLRCRDIFKSSPCRIPPKALANNMALDPIPIEISRLSPEEVRLISQVKRYMKMYLLNKGRGQRALKGMVVHFPQSVEEVVEQLPLALCNADILFVHESFEGVDFTRDIEIRPEYLRAALTWLKSHNPLYRNVQIVIQDYSADAFRNICAKVATPQPTVPILDDHSSFVQIKPGCSVLRASYHQGDKVFRHPGSQCTAMCAVFIAYSAIHSPIEWDKTTLDSVMAHGDSLYGDKRRTIAHNHLEVSEVIGLISNCFGGISVLLDICFVKIFHGYHPKTGITGGSSLSDSLQQFIMLTGSRYAVLTLRGYSMAFAKIGTHLFYFDSHERGKHGWSARSHGKALVLCFDLTDTNSPVIARTLNTTICHNCPVSAIPPNMTQAEIDINYGYTLNILLPIIQSEEAVANDVNTGPTAIEEPLANLCISPDHSPLKKKPRTEHLDSDDGVSELFEASEVNEADDADKAEDRRRWEIHGGMPAVGNFIGNGNMADMDCVIDRDDFVEPEYEKFVEDLGDQAKAKLHRTTGRPINSVLEKDLDLLAFPHLFPTGTNGMNTSRPIPITKTDYFQQRLMGSDKRFSANSDFLFFGLCESEKQRLEQKISVVCSMKTGGTHVESPRDQTLPPGASNPSLYMSAIRGSASYWKRYSGDVIAMVKQIAIPNLFLTFSFDDLNSEDSLTALYKAEYGFDAEHPDITNLPYHEKRELLNKHPITAARHSHMKLNKFLTLLKSNAKDIFGYEISDYTIRVEFQGRGSPHAHCLIWLDGAPDIHTPEGIAFIERNVSCALTAELMGTVLKYQHHRHTPTCYKNKHVSCRFHFPRPVSSTTKVLEDEEIHGNGGRFVQLRRTREEQMINNYHPTLLPVLKCNMDIQPVTGAMAIAYYIAKYISKSEPSTLKTEIRDGIKSVNDSLHLTWRQKFSRISTILMKQREISAQEAAYRMCHLWLRQSSRIVRFLPTFRPEERIRVVQKESMHSGEPKLCNNIITRYMDRPESLKEICLFEFTAHYTFIGKGNFRTELDGENEGSDCEEVPHSDACLNLLRGQGKIFKRNRPAVVKYPNFDPVTDRDAYLYSLMLLFYPFRVENFCTTDASLAVFERLRPQFRTHSDDPNIRLELAEDIDRAILRMTNLDNDPNENNLDFDENSEGDFEVVDDAVPLTQVEVFHVPQVVAETIDLYNTLSPDQRKVVDKVKSQVTNPKTPLRLIVSGEAGTGKSFTINAVRQIIMNLMPTEVAKDSVVVCAPTGIAAFNIQGLTLHRAFALGVELGQVAKYNRLGSMKLDELRKVYRNLKWIILDEMSMINYETLRTVHLRLTEIFQNEEPFGGRNILLFGDLMQLKPPRGGWIFDKPSAFSCETDLWQICEFVELTQPHRQSNSDALLGICSRLRVGTLTAEDVDVLSDRVIDSKRSDYAEKSEFFKDAVRIFPKLAQVRIFNQKKTEELEKSLKAEHKRVYTLNSEDTYAGNYKNGEIVDPKLVHKDEQLCGGLAQSVEIGIGSRIMLRRNISTSTGLVNGALGTVTGITWNWLRREPLKKGELPDCIHVRFDHHQIDGKPEVITKISPVSVNFLGRGGKTEISRKTIPIVLAWAINVHKVQGVTLKKAVVDLGKDLFTKGMAYVSISRVKTLDGLAISSLDRSKLLASDKFTPCDEKALNELNRLRETRK